MVLSFSIKRSMALDGSEPARCKRCFYCRAESSRAHSYENHIFMDYGICHIQHITGINGIARRRTRSSAIPRRAMPADDARDNWKPCKKPFQFDQDTSDRGRRHTFQNSKYLEAPRDYLQYTYKYWHQRAIALIPLAQARRDDSLSC